MKITQLNNYSDKHITYPDELELNKTLTVLAGPNGYGKRIQVLLNFRSGSIH